MPEEIIKALKHLEFDGWNPRIKETYEQEIEVMYTYNEVLTECREESLTEGLKKGHLAGLQKGRLEGSVRGLINEFLAYGKLSPWSVNGIEKQSISLNLVQEVWGQQGELLNKTGIVIGDKSVDDFMGLLKQAGVLKG